MSEQFFVAKVVGEILPSGELRKKALESIEMMVSQGDSFPVMLQKSMVMVNFMAKQSRGKTKKRLYGLKHAVLKELLLLNQKEVKIWKEGDNLLYFFSKKMGVTSVHSYILMGGEFKGKLELPEYPYEYTGKVPRQSNVFKELGDSAFLEEQALASTPMELVNNLK